jgi:hypothetical protein
MQERTAAFINKITAMKTPGLPRAEAARAAYGVCVGKYGIEAVGDFGQYWRGNQKTTWSFIAKAREVHGDRYDYSLVDYVSNRTKVKIICSEHGMFEKTPSNHLNGQGCKHCSGKAKGTTETFIAKAKEVHGDRYNYSLVEYVNNAAKVKIICSEHGVFEQKPNNHLKGRGCRHCAGIAKGTTEAFIAKAKEVHGDNYDYRLVDYVNAYTKVKIICSEHGVFEKTPSNHLNGQGCSHCAGKAKGTTGTFIAKARQVHGGRYDYGLADYVNAHTKVKIICPEHGVFEQAPTGHLAGQGCRRCAMRGKRAPASA